MGRKGRGHSRSLLVLPILLAVLLASPLLARPSSGTGNAHLLLNAVHGVSHLSTGWSHPNMPGPNK